MVALALVIALIGFAPSVNENPQNVGVVVSGKMAHPALTGGVRECYRQ